MPAFPTYILLQTPCFVNTYFVNNSFLSKNLFHQRRRPWRRRPWRDPPLKERPVPPSLPRRDLSPAQAPIHAYGIANTVCPGTCAGEFLLGADEFLEDCGRAWSIAFHGNMGVWMLASLKRLPRLPPAGVALSLAIHQTGGRRPGKVPGVGGLEGGPASSRGALPPRSSRLIEE